MTDKELRRLGRADLIDIIFELRKRCDEYEAENSSLKKELAQKELRVSEAGSIAEAALRLNGVFEAAQAAADQYVASVHAAMRGAADRQSASILEAARKQAERIVAEAERKARQIEGKKDQQDEE